MARSITGSTGPWSLVFFSNSPTLQRGAPIYVPHSTLFHGPGSPRTTKCVGECPADHLQLALRWECWHGDFHMSDSYIQALLTKTSQKSRLAPAFHRKPPFTSFQIQIQSYAIPSAIPKASSDLTALIISALGLRLTDPLFSTTCFRVGFGPVALSSGLSASSRLGIPWQSQGTMPQFTCFVASPDQIGLLV